MSSTLRAIEDASLALYAPAAAPSEIRHGLLAAQAVIAQMAGALESAQRALEEIDAQGPTDMRVVHAIREIRSARRAYSTNPTKGRKAGEMIG